MPQTWLPKVAHKRLPVSSAHFILSYPNWNTGTSFCFSTYEISYFSRFRSISPIGEMMLSYPSIQSKPTVLFLQAIAERHCYSLRQSFLKSVTLPDYPKDDLSMYLLYQGMQHHQTKEYSQGHSVYYMNSPHAPQKCFNDLYHASSRDISPFLKVVRIALPLTRYYVFHFIWNRNLPPCFRYI